MRKQCGAVGEERLSSPFPVPGLPSTLALIYDILRVIYITFIQLEPNKVNKVLKCFLPHYVWMFQFFQQRDFSNCCTGDAFCLPVGKGILTSSNPILSNESFTRQSSNSHQQLFPFSYIFFCGMLSGAYYTRNYKKYSWDTE